MAARTVAAVLACVLVAQVAVAQYAPTNTSGTAFGRGMAANGGSRLTFTNLTLPEMKGVWVNVGSQQSPAAEVALANSTMPDCAAQDSAFSYSGLDNSAEQYLVLAGSGSVNRMVVNLQRSTFSPNVTLNGSLLVVNGTTVSCTHIAPFVDLATGEFMMESIGMTQWALNQTSGKPARTNLNCQVKGNELPGCYTGQVATSSGVAMSPSVAIASIVAPAPRPADAIITVTKTTYRCGNGECLRLAPKYASTSPVYGG